MEIKAQLFFGPVKVDEFVISATWTNTACWHRKHFELMLRGAVISRDNFELK